MTISDRDLIATVHNRFGNRTISRFDYTNDEIGRRIARVDSGEAFAETAFERYAYNDRSEVIGSQRFYGSNISDLSHAPSRAARSATVTIPSATAYPPLRMLEASVSRQPTRQTISTNTPRFKSALHQKRNEIHEDLG